MVLGRVGLLALLAGALVLDAGCSSAPAIPQPQEYLDEQTGATVTVVDAPLVFARERTELAANLRDYVTLAAASVNRGGKLEYVLVAYVWSTVDARYAPASALADSLLLIADDRRITLSANGKTPSELGIARAVHAPAGQGVKPLVFPIDLDTLRLVAAARSLTAHATLGEDRVSYDLWDDQRRELHCSLTFARSRRTA